MKNHILAIAAFGAVAGPALAQSTVTVYGLVDLGVGRAIGSADKAVRESSAGNSRLGFRGTEDLGDGWAAVFQLEHRYRPDLGIESAAGRFWHGASVVGIKSRFGTVTIGRQFQPAFWFVQNQADPFAGLTVANLRDVGMRPGVVSQVAGSPAGVATVPRFRVSDSIRYDFSSRGFNFGASIAEANQENGIAPGPDRPVALAVNYDSAPLFIGLSYENPQGDRDVLWNAAARYTLGPVMVSAGLARGRTEPTATIESRDLRGWLAGVTYRIGSGDFKAGYATSRVGSGPTSVERKRVGLGYHHSLSKRTRLYADIGHEREIDAKRTGVDFGIWHFF